MCLESKSFRSQTGVLVTLDPSESLASKVGCPLPCPIMVGHKAPLNRTWLQPCTESTETGRDRYPRQKEAQRVSMRTKKERRKEEEKDKTKERRMAGREKPYFPKCLLGRQSSSSSYHPLPLSLLSSLPSPSLLCSLPSFLSASLPSSLPSFLPPLRYRGL